MTDNNRPAQPRRGFLTKVLLGWVGLIVIPVFYGIVQYLTPRSENENAAPTILAGKLSEIPENEHGVKLIKFNRKAVFVYRNSDNQVKALSAVCTHLGCIVGYLPAERKFKCNCHGSVFDIDGKNISGPAPSPLSPYRVEIKNDDVILYQS